MAHNSALAALALAGAVASPGIATGRQFMDGAPGHCLLCELLPESRRREANADCRQPSAADVGESERTDERAGGGN
jgi:hypothetical protein